MSARRGQKRRTGGGPKPAPVSVQKLFQRALDHHGAGRVNEAAALYAQVLALEPRHTSSWTNLGIVFRTRGSFEGAVASYRRALELNPDDPGVLGNLGNVLKDLGRLEESLAAHRKAAAARPNDHSTRYNFGIALKQAADLDGALAEFDAAHRLKPDASGPPWDRALALLQLGRFEEGWKAYESRWNLPDHPPRPYSFSQWHGEPFEGRTLLVHPEQGFGDAIIACRFLPLVKARGGTVLLECKPELRRLLSELEGVDRIVPPGQPPEGVDLHCPVMSLAGLFGTTMGTLPPVPRLHVPEEARNRFRPVFARHADRFKVGIIWSGSITFKGSRDRATGLDRFIPLAEVPGVQLYSLQKGPPEVELRDSGLSGTLVIDIGGRVGDFADTAAAVEQLDLVVMTDSATAHLAGSLGRPVWNLLNFVPYWMYGLEGEETPWYPSMRLFRQRWPRDWDGVFDHARTALADAVVAKREGRWPK